MRISPALGKPSFGFPACDGIFGLQRPLPPGFLVVLDGDIDENMRMLSRWYYSFGMLVAYVSLFEIWKFIPSRIAFVGLGGFTIVVLVVGMIRARRFEYFVNRLDIGLHMYVIADLCLETIAFEAFRITQPYAVVEQFHNNSNFLGCALAFTVLVGGYRWFALPTSQKTAGSAYGHGA